MSDEADGPRPSAAFPDGVIEPIAGLLALLFAVMAGMSLGTALSGSPVDYAFPVALAVVSLAFFELRRRAGGGDDE